MPQLASAALARTVEVYHSLALSPTPVLCQCHRDRAPPPDSGRLGWTPARVCAFTRSLQPGPSSLSGNLQVRRRVLAHAASAQAEGGLVLSAFETLPLFMTGFCVWSTLEGCRHHYYTNKLELFTDGLDSEISIRKHMNNRYISHL